MADSKKKEKAPKQAPKQGGVTVPKLVGITVPKETNCGQWYVEVVQKAELVEYYSEVSRRAIDRPICCCWTPANHDMNACIDLRILHPATYVQNTIQFQRISPSSLPPIGDRQLTMTHSTCDAHLEHPEEVFPIPH